MPGNSILEGSVAKGYYTQGAAVLLNAPIKIDVLEKLLDGFSILERREGGPTWHTAGPMLVLEFRPKVNGVILVDLVDQPWPDSMGCANDDPSLFAAWGTGQFGPFCFPGSLSRACQYCLQWREGAALAAAHKAFVRIRITYSLDAPDDQVNVPKNPMLVEETEMLIAVAEAILEHKSAICYFNPNGEVLAPLAQVAQMCEHFSKNSAPAVTMLSNRRVVKFEGSDWLLMDTVGLGQLDITDLEACFTEEYDLNEVAMFLVNTALHIAKLGPVIKDGYTMTGPKGMLFEARKFDEPKLVPPRQVLRFRPRDGKVSPPELGFGDKPFGKAAWWQFWKL